MLTSPAPRLLAPAFSLCALLVGCTSPGKDSAGGTGSTSAGDSDGTSAGDSGGTTDACAGKAGWLEATGGGITDLTADLSAGTAAAPAAIPLTTPGVVHLGPGTWYAAFSVNTAAMSFVAEAGARPVLSGGNVAVVVDIPTDGASVTLTGFDITEGKGCLGSAVRAASIPECNRDGVAPVAANVTLTDMHIYGNTYDIGGGAVGITHGSSLVMTDTEISHNDGHGVYVQEGHVTCTGSTGDRAGSWANTKYGVWVEFFDGGSWTVQSTGCDFGADAEDNGYEDVMFNHDAGFEYGDDVTFSCDSATLGCI